jgi:hypothetical protein
MKNSSSFFSSIHRMASLVLQVFDDRDLGDFFSAVGGLFCLVHNLPHVVQSLLLAPVLELLKEVVHHPFILVVWEFFGKLEPSL